MQLVDENLIARPMALGWDYSQVRKCSFEQVASDLASLCHDNLRYGTGVGFPLVGAMQWTERPL